MQAYDYALDALGDPTRRLVLEQLRAGPKAVGEIADRLPVSRPAVSQHLRVLKGAGIVRDERAGTRRLYRIDEDGLSSVRAYLEGLWDDALGRLKSLAEREREGGKGDEHE